MCVKTFLACHRLVRHQHTDTSASCVFRVCCCASVCVCFMWLSCLPLLYPCGSSVFHIAKLGFVKPSVTTSELLAVVPINKPEIRTPSTHRYIHKHTSTYINISNTHTAPQQAHEIVRCNTWCLYGGVVVYRSLAGVAVVLTWWIFSFTLFWYGESDGS
jgi:hypothetical protein